MSKKFTIATWGGIFLGLLYLLWLTAPMGPGATPDSANYLAAARAMASGEAWVIMGDRPLLWWPPLFPWIWSLFLRFDLQPLTSVLAMNLVAWVGFGYAWARLCQRNLKEPSLFWLCWLATILSLAHVRIFAQALSDAGFLALTAWSLLWLQRSQSQPTYRAILIAACFAAAACMWRYLGVTLVVAGAVYLWFEQLSLAERVRRQGLWASVSLTPLVAWLMRNWFLSGTLTGPRPPAVHSFLKQAYASVSALASWLTNPLPHHAYLGWVLLILMFGLGLIFLWRIASNLRVDLFQTPTGRFAGLLCLFPALYLLAFLILSSLTFTSLANTRFIAPVIAPLALGCCMLMAKTWQDQPTSKQGLWLSGAWLWLVIFLGTGFFLAHHERREGWGIRTHAWQSSQLIAHLKTLPQGPIIYSNARPEIYLHTGHDGAGLPNQAEQLASFAAKMRQTGAIIAWSSLPHKGRKPYDRHNLWSLFPNGKSRPFADGWLLVVPGQDQEPKAP